MAGRPRREPETSEQELLAIRKRANELVEMGIPHQMAMAVAGGKLDLNDVLQRLAFREKVTRLEREHELSRALATQIALGQASLDRVLSRRRFDVYRSESLRRSVLEEACEDGRQVTLGCHGGRNLRGVIAEVEAYAIQFQTQDGEREEIHKLQIKFVYRSDDYKRVRKAMKWDKALKAEPREPVTAPQDRYGCSDKRLFRYLEQGPEVEATLLEGELLRGRVGWFARYEFALEVKGGAEVVVFRHALADLRET